MSNKTSNPISVNQIVDTNLDLKCITPNSCRDLTNDVQALINDYCDNKYDKSKIIKGCLPNAGEDINEMLNFIIANGLCDETVVPTPTLPFITNLNLCDTDDWNYDDLNCLNITDECDNPKINYTEIDVIRALIKRVLRLQILLSVQHSSISTLTTNYNQLSSTVNNILNNCCNVTLINQIQALSSRVTNVEQNCCS